MKQFAKFIIIGSTIIICFLIPLYIGIKTNHALIGILAGGVIALTYLFKEIIDEVKKR